MRAGRPGRGRADGKVAETAGHEAMRFVPLIEALLHDVVRHIKIAVAPHVFGKRVIDVEVDAVSSTRGEYGLRRVVPGGGRVEHQLGKGAELWKRPQQLRARFRI